MDNVEVKLTKEGKMLIVIDPTQDFGESKSGKTRIVASTRGSQSLMIPDVGTVSVSVNVFKK